MAKTQLKSKPSNENNNYTRLLVFPKRKLSLFLGILICVILFTSLLHKEIPVGTPWIFLVVPITLAGSIFLLFPPTEEWEYRSWQNAKQKQERMFFD